MRRNADVQLRRAMRGRSPALQPVLRRHSEARREALRIEVSRSGADMDRLTHEPTGQQVFIFGVTPLVDPDTGEEYWVT